MKHKASLLSLLVTGSLLAGCHTHTHVPEGEFLIEGHVTGVPDSIIMKLMRNEGRLLTTVTYDTIINGRFTLRDTIGDTEAHRMCLVARSTEFPSTWLDVWVQSGKRVVVKGKDKLIRLWKVNSDVAEQKYTNDFMALCPDNRRRIDQINIEENALHYKHGLTNEDREKLDSLYTLSDKEESIISNAELNYMLTAPISPVWLDYLVRYMEMNQAYPELGYHDRIQTLYARMSEVDKATPAGLAIEEYMNAFQAVEVNNDMADGDLYDVNGQVHHLAEFKGKYILLDFWSMGCAPCRMAMPEIREIEETYRGKMEMVSISTDPERAWKKFVAEEKLQGNQWNELRRGDTGLAAAYQVNGIPHFVMISPEGKILEMWSGYGEGSLKSKVAELVK